MKDCQGCPSFLDATKAAKRYGSRIGVPACGKFDQLLGKPGVPDHVNVTIRTSKAGACAEYGKPYHESTTLAANAMAVSTPDTSVVMAGPRAVGDRAPSTCAECVNYVPAPTVNAETGWPMPMCAATGRLLLSNKLTAEANACSWGRYGSPRTSTAGMMENPLYSGTAIEVKGAPKKDPLTDFIDPLTYETDREVTADERAFGIRAWRHIFNPKGTGQYVPMPIFDPESFPEDEQYKIPTTGDDTHPEWYVDHDGLVYRVLVAWFGTDRVPMLWGDAGTGKTELYRHLAWMMQVPFERTSVTDELMIEEIAGEAELSVPPWKEDDPDAKPEKWWRDGVGPRRWERCGVWCIDEPNTGQPAVFQYVRPMMDNSKQLVVNDQPRERHPFCMLGFAMNPAWKPQYVGTREISTAEISRAAHIWVSLPPEDLERKIIVRACQTNDPPYNPPKEIVDAVMAIAKDLRAKVESGQLPICWNIRENMKVLAFTQYLDLHEAFRMGVTDALETETANEVLQSVKAHYRG